MVDEKTNKDEQNHIDDEMSSIFDSIIDETQERQRTSNVESTREQLTNTKTPELLRPSELEYKTLNLPLNGKLVTSIDGTQLGEGDFQVLKNMRYTDAAPKSIAGMTKINTSVINATYFKPRSGFQFNKVKPTSEAKVMVQAWNTGLTASKVYENAAAVPAQANFSGTETWADSTGAGTGYFSEAPDDSIAYCNGVDTCIWSDEHRVASFFVSNMDGSIKYDYTTKINNTLDDSNNIAVLGVGVGDYSIDANTMLLLHLDNNVTDSSPTGHVVNNDAAHDITFSDTIYTFATHSGLWNGVDSYLDIPDHANFDFSSGTGSDSWTMDFRVKPDSTGGATQSIYYQETDADNYIWLALIKSGTKFKVKLSILAATVEVLGTTGLETGYVIEDTTWHHIAVQEDNDNWSIFIDGRLQASLSDTHRAANYNGLVYIGASDIAAVANYLKGFIDEFRISNVARYSGEFDPLLGEYGSGTAYIYIGSIRPIYSIGFYIKTANTATATANAYYWNNGWNPTTGFVDGTSSGGKTMAVIGYLLFTSTVTTAKPRMYCGAYLYWYLVTLTGIDSTTSIYHSLVNSPMQQVVDLWDGIYRPITSCLKRATGTTIEKYLDFTVGVLENNYVAGDTTTFMNLQGLTTSQYLLLGFSERSCGFNVQFVHSGAAGTDRTNETPCFMTVYYWNGSGWTATDGLNDGTLSNGNISFGKNGNVTWQPPTESLEFKSAIGVNTELYWYYKVVFSNTLSSTVYPWVDKLEGIPAQKLIKDYAYPVLWQSRVVLLNNKSFKQNSLILSSQNSVCVFNGSDAISPDAPLEFGGLEGLVAGGAMFTRFGGNAYEDLVLCKKNETWLLTGTSPADYKQYKVSDDGCVAPGTFKVCNTGFEVSPGLLKHVVIWQSDSAINLFDGNAVMVISGDIEDLFDRNKTVCIHDSMIHKSEAFFDERMLEYHWLFASGSSDTLNKEFVYDMKRKKWYEITRGTGSELQIGFPVRDTYGNAYNYGGIETGYITRLENGTTFVTAASTNSIVSQFRTGDIAMGDWQYLTEIRKIKHIAIAKSTTVNSVAVTHYGDCNLSATVNKSNGTALSLTHAVNSTVKRVVSVVKSVALGNFNFHSFACSLTTTDETCGYEPVGISLRYKIIREEIL